MEKRIIMMYSILILIMVISIAGYFIHNSLYTETLNSEFESNLNAAHGYYQERLIKMDESSAALPPTIRQNNGYDAEQMKKVMEIDKQSEELLNKEIDSLNEAKKNAISNTPKEYIDLLIDSRESNQKYFETLLKLMETNLKFAQGTISLGEQNSLIGQYSDELSSIEKDTSKLDKIKTFLESNPDFKEKLVNMGLKGEYLGETS